MNVRMTSGRPQFYKKAKVSIHHPAIFNALVGEKIGTTTSARIEAERPDRDDFLVIIDAK